MQRGKLSYLLLLNLLVYLKLSFPASFLFRNIDGNIQAKKLPQVGVVN